jgi:integrase/recombinase XerC
MKSLKFSEFYKGQFADDGFELYLLKDSEEKVLYIGISRVSIWHRWFGGGTSHMDIDSTGKIRGRSYVGEVIERCLPNSWEWMIELWSREDCLNACNTELSGKDVRKLEIEGIEPYMIVKFGPLYNLTHVSESDEDPVTPNALLQAILKVDKTSVITIAQAKTMFLESIKPPGSVNTHTRQAYKTALDTFLNMLATHQIDSSSFPVAELRENSITDFVDYMKGFSPATESLYLHVVKNFFKFLDAENLAPVKLSRIRTLIRQRARRSRRQPVGYPEEDVKQFIGFMTNTRNFPVLDDDQLDNEGLRDARDRALILTLADTGLRLDEICKLRCSDLDFEANGAILRSRNKKQTFVPFSSRSINAIKAYLSHRKSLDLENSQISSSLPLFARHDKGAGRKIQPVTPTTVRNIVAERVQQALGDTAVGSITPHTFLHYFVTTILQATGNLKLAQVLARHTNIQITQKYAHISERELNQSYSEIFDKEQISEKV